MTLFLLYWKTRNIWACAIVHGLFDFFPSISGAIYNSGVEETSGYVMAGRSKTRYS
jgi:membrane protease YdiL (CAAX protease family)